MSRWKLSIAMASVLAACAAPPSPQPEAITQPAVTSTADGAPVPVMAGRPSNTSRLHPPNYPSEADQAHLEGFVDFQFTLEPDGSVADIKVIQEVPAGYGFAREAMRVFPTFKFTPKIVDGVPVAVPANYRMSFKLAR
jgi:protein TonB